MKNKKHISFFADKKQIILIEQLKLYNLKMDKPNDVGSVIMDAVTKRIETIEKGAFVPKNQKELF